MMVRPERIRLGEAGMPGWSGEIREVEYLGPFVRYRVSLGEQLEIIVNHPNEGQARLARGAQVSLSWPEQAIHRLSASGSGLSHEPPHSASLAMSHATEPARLRPLRRLSTLLYGRPGLLLGILLGPPLLWLGIIYVGSLLMLLSNAFFGLDEFSGQVRHELGLQNFIALLRPENLDVIGRTVGMSLLVTLACALLGFPIAYYMARYTSGKTRALFYVGIMLPLWSSYLVRVYAWKLILAKEGVISWLADSLGLEWLLDGILSLPVIGGPSLSFSRLGTFIVFVYV